MERGTAAKPYHKILANYPQFKEEIDSLDKKCYEVISMFPYKSESYGMEKEDFFSMLVLLCLEANSVTSSRNAFRKQACELIQTAINKKKQEASKLYNPHRNICLDQCYGESKTPLGAWMDFTTVEEE